MMAISVCPNCGGKQLYKSAKSISAGGGYAPNYLPGLGTFFSAAKFDLVMCSNCGLTLCFAEPEARAKVVESPKWTRV